MASEDATARRYAQAALELANESGTLATWTSDLELIGEAWQNGGLRRFAEDRKLGREQRIARVKGDLEGKVSHLALNLVLLLVMRGRAHLVPRLIAQFDMLCKKQADVMEAEVTSAIPLTQAQSSQLAQALAERPGQKVSITNTVDPAILGGLIIRQGDRLRDASVAGKLRQLEQRIGGVSPAARRGRLV